jgi:hypothetical protein
MGGTAREMDAFEVWLRGLAKRALTGGNLRAALESQGRSGSHRNNLRK